VTSSDLAAAIESRTKMLDVRETTVSFGGVHALSQISLTARVGEIVGIIGPNGAGKTTLLNAICGLVPMDGGEITVAGRSIKGLYPSGIAALGLARTFQSSQIFRGMTVLENVMTGMHLPTRTSFLGALFATSASLREERRVRDASMEMLEYVGMAGFAERRGSDLSFGQQRLVELARTLVREPSIILLDEPGVGLSVDRLAELGELLQRIRAEKNVTLVLIEHVLRLIMQTCDRVVVLSGGMKLADGPPAAVVADPLVISAYLGTGFYAERATT